MTTFVGPMKNKMIQNSSWSFLLVRFYLVGKIFCVIFSLFHYHICSFLLSLNKILRLGNKNKNEFSFYIALNYSYLYIRYFVSAIKIKTSFHFLLRSTIRIFNFVEITHARKSSNKFDFMLT